MMNSDEIEDGTQIEKPRLYKPTSFRPASLSIITVTPEIQESLQKRYKSFNQKFYDEFDDEDEDEDEEDYDNDDNDFDDFDENEEDNNLNNGNYNEDNVDKLREDYSNDGEINKKYNNQANNNKPNRETSENRFSNKEKRKSTKRQLHRTVNNGIPNPPLTITLDTSHLQEGQNSFQQQQQDHQQSMNNQNRTNSLQVNGTQHPNAILQYFQPMLFNGGSNNNLSYDSVSASGSFQGTTLSNRKPTSILKNSQLANFANHHNYNNHQNNHYHKAESPSGKSGTSLSPDGPNGSAMNGFPGPGSDSNSIGGCSIANTSDNISVNLEYNRSVSRQMNDRTIKLLSVMYGLAVVMVGSIITIGDLPSSVNDIDHLYSIVTTIMGLCFLIFIHFDIQRHKQFVVSWNDKCRDRIEAPMKSSSHVDFDSVSINTMAIFNRDYMDEEVDDETKSRLNSYKFITGKHSGSFYLKCGMILFCMGSIVHQGISFAIQVHFFATDVVECKNAISFIVYLTRCISAFYQLYMAFKYSNLIINRNHAVVRFGLMHLLGTSISFWFSTIIEEAMDGYMRKVRELGTNSSQTEDILLKEALKHHIRCANKTMETFSSSDAIPYMYAFSIEFNIILASVWYIIWTNVGNNESASDNQLIREELNENRHTGKIDVDYRSNLSINVDCHASNLGLFGGLFSLLIIMTTTIIFFTTITNSDYKKVGISIFTGQFGFLTLCCLVAIMMAYRHTRTLNVVKGHHLDNPSTAMDDFLLMVPLPFYYVHHFLCIYAELLHGSVNSVLLGLIYLLHLIQVTVQTPFIVDGIRRCSNEKKLRYRKPGKPLVTFAIIINVTLWILITFEIKSVDKYHSMPHHFGKFVWMIVLDTCLPLMLFYRFHSSVCLSDIWKHAYEKDEH